MIEFKPSMAAIAMAAALSLTACGGGGGSSGGTGAGPGASAEGVYGGTLSGASVSNFQMLVLDDGEYWVMYGNRTADRFLVAGFAQGHATTSNGKFTSSDARDFSTIPATSGTISATYTSTPSISGTVKADAGGTASFSGGPIPGSLYDFDARPQVSDVVGSWSLTTLQGSPMDLQVAPNGSFTANSNGCSISGTMRSHSSGKNVFALSITFGGAPCALAGQRTTGIGVAYPVASGATQLLVAAVNGDRTVGAAAFGTR